MHADSLSPPSICSFLLLPLHYPKHALHWVTISTSATRLRKHSVVKLSHEQLLAVVANCTMALSLFPVDWGQLQGHQHVCSWENGANWERSRLSLRHEHAVKVFRICTVNICCVKNHELSGDSRRGSAVQTTPETSSRLEHCFSPSRVRVRAWLDFFFFFFFFP